MRVLLDKLGITSYGVWLTIFSVLSWIALADIGIGIGLRNKLAESIARKNITKSKSLVSTGYFLIALLVLIIYFSYRLLSPLIDWQSFFGIVEISNHILNPVMELLIITFLLNFIFSLINHVSFANQDAYIPSVIPVFINVIILIVAYLLPPSGDFKNFQLIAYTYGIVTLFVNVFFNFYLFRKKYRYIIPHISYFKFEHVKDLINLGYKFFIVQIAVIIIFSTDNYLVLRFVGSEDVVEYQAVFKIFSTVVLLHTIVSTPLWSAYTEAFAMNDFKWIKRILKKMMLFLVPLSVCVIILSFITPTFIDLWLNIGVNKELVVVFVFYTIIMMWNNIFSYFLNGVNRVNVQMFTSIVAAIINIPMSYYFSVYLEFGASGILMGSIVSLSIPAIALPLTTYSFFKKTVSNMSSAENKKWEIDLKNKKI